MNLVRSPALEEVPGIAHGFFGRQGGISQGVFASLNCGLGSSDDPAHAQENRSRARQALGAEALVTLYQVHSDVAVVANAPWTRDDAPRADGMVTAMPGLALGILAADCAPVLMVDREARVIAAAHAGWKGAQAGIVEATVKAMEGLGAQRARIAAAIGPCIGQDAYEVGPEFFDGFVLANPALERFFVPSERIRHWRFDLAGYVAARLAHAGIGTIEPLEICTYTDEEGYFSYRRTTHRQEPDYGRNLSAIMLVP